VVECREALAYWRISRAVDAEAGHLGRPGVDRLVSQLRGAAAR
jgi:environmental stress-induced protein Ves